MQCLNVKNKEVAALLEEYTNILGNENAAYYVLSENNGYGLDKAPNGADSKLFSDLLNHYNGDRNKAILAKSRVYSDSFRNWFGDWLSDDKSNASRVVDFNDSVDFLFEVNPELAKVGTKSEYEQYIKTIFPNSVLNSIYWHGTDSDFSDGLNTAKRGKGSGAPETKNEMYFNRQPWASLQYISGINRNIPDIEGYNNWVKLWWELKEALGNGRMDTDDWKNEIIGPNIRQTSPNKKGIFDRDKGGEHGKYLSERKARYGYENKTDKEFFEEVFDIRYGKETFNDWINRKRDEFKSLWNNRSVKNGIIPAVLNVRNPIVEEGQNTYYEEQRGLFTQAKQNGNDAILSNKSKNEFGSDVAIVFNPNENVHFLGTKSDIENFKKWKSNNQVSKVVDENGEPLIVYHGSDNGISDNVIDLSKSDDGISFFTTKDIPVSESYMTSYDDAIEYINNQYYSEEEIENLLQNNIDYWSVSDKNDADDFLSILDISEETSGIERTNVKSNVLISDINGYNPYTKKEEKGKKYIQTIEFDIYIPEGYDVPLNLQDLYNLSKNDLKTLKNEAINKHIVLNPSVYTTVIDTDAINKADSLRNKQKRYSLFESVKNPLIINSEYTYNWNKVPFEGNKYTTREIAKIAKDRGYDGVIFNNIIDDGGKSNTWNGMAATGSYEVYKGDNFETVYRYDTSVFVAFDPNQIKSIDNQGTFSTSDNNIYNQEAQSQTGTGRNEELASILSELYPNIEVGQLNNPNLRGQAQVEGYMAGRVLLNSLLENQDTLPHEYAHHYIAWFRNAPIVQKGIEKFSSEESLVQAIGENSVKAIRWYNRFFNWIKGLFSSKQRVLNSLTNSFLKGEHLSYGSLIKTEIHNQQAKQIPSSINKIYDKIMTGLERRIADIEFSKFKGNRENSLRRLQFRMNQLENDKATLEFIDYMNDDIATQKRELSRMLDAYRLYKSNGTPHGITQEQLDVIRKGYIGFYDNLITNLQNVIDDESSFEYFNDPKLIEQTLDSIKLTLSDFNESVRIFNRIVDSIAKDNMLDNASRISDYTRAQLDKIFDEGDFELSWWDRYIGQTQYINDPLVQLLLNKLVTAKNEVYDEKLKVGKKLLDLSSKVSPSDIKLLQERDKDGKRTGYLVSALNRGAHRAAYMSFLTNLANEMGYPDADVHTLPETLSDEEYRYWNARINEWDAANTERKFVPEYYEITNILSLEAKRRRDDINNELQLILLPTIDDEGNFHKEKLSDAEYAKYEALQTKRRNLANPFYEDGTEKLGIDKQVAQEFQEYNKRLSEKLKYKTNYEKFNKAYNKAKSELSEDDFKKWIKRNTVVRITQAFYDEIKKLSSGKVKSAHQLTLEEARNNLLKLYTKPDGTVDIDSIPTNVKSMIIEYDSLINQESAQTPSEKKSEIYLIAEFKVDPRYLQQYEFYSKKGGAEFDAWLVQNTYTDAYGNIQPASFWKKLVPKAEFRKYYMERVPNRDWSEIDKESAFYNPNFDESYGESRIPKKSKYGNKDFEKVQNNPKLKALYDALLDTKKESNSYIYFARFLNPYLLPQIDGGAWNTISRSDNVLKGLGLAALNAVTVQEKDEKYNKSKALRSDGTAVKLVPTRYLTQLDNPDTITDDVVGSIIHFYGMAYNYKRMSELAPEMETILDFTSRLDVKTDKGESLNTKSTRLYSKVEELINTFVYGMESDPLEVRIPKTNRKVSVDKILTGLANYTRKVGISQNLNVILTGMVTNKVMNRLEAITGLNYTNSELTAASVIIQKSYANALLNIGNANNKNKTLCFLEFTGVVRDADRTFKDLHNNRILKQHFWYFGHEMSDYVTKGKMVIAIALHSKYIPEYNKFMTRNEFFRTVKDKKKANALWRTYSTTLYDAFEVNNNQLVVKDEFKDILDERTINKFRNTCKQVGTKIDTQLTELDKNWIQANIFGKLLFIYRNFLIIGLQNKFLTKPQFNIVTGMFQDSQFHAAWKAIQTYLSKEKLNQLRELYKDNFEEVDEYNKAMLRRITTEIVFAYILSFIITTVLRSLADDDKDDFFKNEMALIGARAGIELRSNIIPVEAINMFGNPSAAWSTLEYFYELTTAPFDDPMEKVTKGPYKGMYRYQRSLIKASPFRSIYEAQDPRSKLQYYNNFSLY